MIKRQVAKLLAGTLVISSMWGVPAGNVNAKDMTSRRNAFLEFDTNASDTGYVAAKRIEQVWGTPEEVQDSRTAVYGASSIPKAYMNSIKKIKKKFPDPRNQGSYGTCWAVSSIALAEFNLISQGKANRDINLSELQLAYYTFHNVTDCFGGIKGDKNGLKSSTNYLSFGGNRYISSRILATWKGAIDESDMPYSDAGKYENGKMATEYAYDYNQYILRNAYIMNSKDAAGRKDIKKAIMKNGAVGIDYYAYNYDGSKTAKYNKETVATYYCPEYQTPNHAVTIVGWDDNFSKSNFNSNGKKPSKNGAWLIRNSWSDKTENSEYSYFWISYYDGSLSSDAWSFEMTDADEYDSNYQYDGGFMPTGVWWDTDYNQLDAAANVFTARNNETIKSVMLSNTCNRLDQYTVSVYTNLEDETKPTSGTLACQQTGKNSYAGLFTVDLKTPVAVGKGEKFAVVVHWNSGSYDAETSYNEKGSYEGLKTVVAPSGHSYYLVGDEWHVVDKHRSLSMGIGDFSIKALTVSDDHEFGEPQYVWSKDGKECKVRLSCKDNDRNIYRKCRIKRTIITPATYFEKGTATYTATYSCKGVDYKTSKTSKNLAVSKLAAVKLTTAKTNKSRKLSLKWSKCKDASGYEVQYSLYKKFSNAKVKKYKKASKVSATITRPVKRSAYYVRVRAYLTKKINGKTKTVYSAWSPAKLIK